MLRIAVKNVAWVGRATVFLVGLAVILALVLGVATTAAAHSGFAGLFHLEHNNPVTVLSKMTGSVANGVLQVTNQSALNTTQGASAITAINNSATSPTMRSYNAKGGPAMELNVACPSMLHCVKGPPMNVDSTGRVDKLNSDLLDGKDSTAFISGYEVVIAETVSDSIDVKFKHGYCPPGKRALGGGAQLIGEEGKVVVTRSEPIQGTGGWYAEAREIVGSGSTGSWSLVVHAICAEVGP